MAPYEGWNISYRDQQILDQTPWWVTILVWLLFPPFLYVFLAWVLSSMGNMA